MVYGAPRGEGACKGEGEGEGEVGGRLARCPQSHGHGKIRPRLSRASGRTSRGGSIIAIGFGCRWLDRLE